MVVASQLTAAVSATGVDTTQSQLRDVGNTVTQTGGIFKNALGGALSLAAGAAGQALGFLKTQVVDGIGLAIQHQDVMTQTAKVLKSTGDASGMTQRSLENLASSLEKTTYFSKDQTEQGENMLLTFTNIGKDVFPLATKTMLDMSKAMGQDVKSTAIMMGKALDDPATGLTALTRVGVTFSSQQQEMIKHMVAVGDTAGAQKIMLQELQHEFGGSADATTTLAGKWAILTNRMNDFKERAATGLFPVLGALMDHLVSPAMDTAESLFHKIGDAVSYVGNVLRTVNLSDFLAAWRNIEILLGSIEVHISRGLSPALKLLKTDADPVAAVIGNLAQGALNILSNILWSVEGALMAVDREMSTGKGPMTDFFGTAKSFLPDIQNIASLLGGQFKDAFKFAGESAKQVGGWFRTSVVPALKDVMPGFLSLAHTILQDVIPAAIQIRGVLMDVIEHALQKFGPILGQIIPPLIRFAEILAQDVSNGLKFIMPYIEQAAKALGQFADEIMDRVAPIVQNLITGLTPLVQGFMSWWNQNLPTISAVAKGVFDEIVGIVEIAWALVSGIIKIGLDLLSGNWHQAWQDMLDMFGGIWDGIKQYVSGGMEILRVELSAIEGVVNTYLVKPFQNALGSIGGVFHAIGQLISDATALNWGAIPGDLHSLGIPGFAGGTDYAPGGWGVVGEQGPEAMYIPRGAVIRSAAQTAQMMSGGYASSGGGQPIILQIDGRTFARGYMPYHVEAVRNATGVRF